MWQILCRASPPTVDEHAVIPESILSILAVCSMMALSQLSPGPDVFFVFRTSLAQGYKRGLAVALGINTGVFVQGIIICTLGSYVLEQSWSRWIIYAAAAWLLYLAWKIFPKPNRAAAGELSDQQETKESIPRLLLQGFLCNIFNAKCYLFLAGLTAHALYAHASLSWYIPALLGSLFVTNMLGWCLWSGLLQLPPVRTTYLRHIRIIDAFFAAVLAAFAILLIAH